jgi:hypothetical protein
MSYLPWWLGALALGLVALLHVLFDKRLLGVTAKTAKAANLLDDTCCDLLGRSHFAPRVELVDEAEMKAMLRRSLSESGMAESRVELRAVELEDAFAEPSGSLEMSRKSLGVIGDLTFLLMLAVGGAIGALWRGDLHFRFDLGDAHSAIFGHGLLPVIVLFGGGLLVGIGTRMAGGCTSGHGLSGSARLQPGSLVSTACFFGSAIVVALLLKELIA